MYSKGNTTHTQIQSTVDHTSALMEVSLTAIQSRLSTLISTLPDEVKSQPQCKTSIDQIQSAMALATHAFQGLETEKLRIAEFKKQGLVMPQSYEVGVRSEKQTDGTLKQVPAVAQYISLLDLVKSYAHYKFPDRQRDPEIIRDYRDGQLYGNSDYFRMYPEAFCLVLYNDDIELANPLGSRAGVHKLTMFYVTLQGTDSSSLAAIHPVIVAYASDVKLYGYDSILKPLVRDLKLLDSGLKISIAGENVCIRARLVQLVGDNLAANQTIGLVQSFRADFFCRFCMMPREQCETAVRADSQRLRTRQLHDIHLAEVAANPQSYKHSGVKRPVILDTLSYFSVIESTVPDCMHDILEGIGKRELKLILNSLAQKKIVTLDTFNDRLISFDYG